MARKEKKFHYLYKITNTKNGKYYIGMHSTDNLEDGYFGSGKRITNSIRRHGKEAHKKEILEYFDNRESLRQNEIKIVNEDLLNDPMCMNLQPGGGGGFGNEEHRIKCQKAGAIATNKLNRIHYLIENDAEWRETFSNQIKKGQLSGNQGFKKSFSNKSHTDEVKKIIGDKNSIHQKGSGNSQFGTCWIHDLSGNVRKIRKSDINIYLLDGWIRGRKIKDKL
jgi:hypothetical protein